MTDIENALKNKDITSEMRKKLTDLQNTIEDNDNNYVMIAKLKKIASHEQTTTPHPVAGTPADNRM